MATILQEGCIQSCGYCTTKFSFLPNEVKVSKRDAPPGYEPGEEAYKKSVFTVSCPKCHATVDVSTSLGAEGKHAAEVREKKSELREDHDL